MKRTLIVLTANGTDSAVLNALTHAAEKLAHPIDLMIFSDSENSIPKDIPSHIDQAMYYLVKQSTRITYAQVAHVIMASYATDHFPSIICASGTFSKELLPHLGAKTDTMPLTDVIDIDLPRFKRGIYAGNIIETVEKSEPYLISIRTGHFKIDLPTKQAQFDIIQSIDDLPTSNEQLISVPSDLPDLSVAKVIFSGGRGLGSKENFSELADLAKQYNAGLGASRAAVDLGYIANEHQVGQTGKIVTPTIYVAFGISGAVQHLAGMKDSGYVIAINQDADAPIFENSDLGYCGDLFAVIKALTTEK